MHLLRTSQLHFLRVVAYIIYKLLSVGLLSRATGFGSEKDTLGIYAPRVYILGVYTLGVYTLVVYTFSGHRFWIWKST